jgi:hypothetical protein
MLFHESAKKFHYFRRSGRSCLCISKFEHWKSFGKSMKNSNGLGAHLAAVHASMSDPRGHHALAITAGPTCATPPCSDRCTAPHAPPPLCYPPRSPDDETKSPFATLQALPFTVFERQAATPLHHAITDVRSCHTPKQAPSCATPHHARACFLLQH